MKKRICLIAAAVLILCGTALPAYGAVPDGFQEGYVSVSSGTKAYRSASEADEAGYFPKGCAVYARAVSPGWLEAAFIENSGKQKETVYLRAGDAAALNENQAASLKDGLTRSRAAKHNGWPVTTVAFAAQASAPAVMPATVPGAPEDPPSPSPAEEPEAFSAGYVTVPGGTTAYRAPSRSAAAGVFPAQSVVYAIPAGNGWLEAAFRDADTKKTSVVYLPQAGLTALPAAEADALRAALARSRAPKYEGEYLTTVRLSASAAPSPSRHRRRG